MNNLKELRIKRCMSQVDLSVASKITVQTIIGIEKNRHHPKFVTIRKLAKALDVGVEELYFE